MTVHFFNAKTYSSAAEANEAGELYSTGSSIDAVNDLIMGEAGALTPVLDLIDVIEVAAQCAKIEPSAVTAGVFMSGSKKFKTLNELVELFEQTQK